MSEINDVDLEKIIVAPFVFPKLPLHSTSVERAVRLATNASAKVILSQYASDIPQGTAGLWVGGETQAHLGWDQGSQAHPFF